MKKTKSFPQPIPILMAVIVLAAICTWLLPAGQYNKLSVVERKSFVMSTSAGEVVLPFTQKTLDSLGLLIPIQKFINGDVLKPVSVPGTYKKLERNPQGILNILQAPVKGIYDSIDIILFVLIIGGFIYVFNETKAIEKGVAYLAYSMRGKEPFLMVILIIVFALGRATYGMEEEALAFYPILVPLFLAAGYDLLVPLAIIFGGNSVGGIASFLQSIFNHHRIQCSRHQLDGWPLWTTAFICYSHDYAHLVCITIRCQNKKRSDCIAGL